MNRFLDRVLRRPRVWLLGNLIVTLAFAALLPQLELRTDGAAIHPRNSFTVRASESDRARFHDSEAVLVLVRAGETGPPLVSRAGLATVRALHDSLATLPGVRAPAIRSIARWPDPRAGGGPMAPAALANLPATDDEAARLADDLRRDPVVRGLLLASDGRSAALEVPLDPGFPRPATLAGIERWIRRTANDSLRIDVLGPVVAEVQLGQHVLEDLTKLVPIMLLAIAVLLAISLRTPGGVLVPLVEALLVVVWTLGTMALCRVPVTLVTTIMPVVLVAMAITDEIHWLDRLRAHLHALPEPSPSRAAVREAVRATMRDVQGPIVATSITTAIGFFSFSAATLPPLRDFGIFTGCGILFAMLLTFSLVPALVVTLPIGWFERRGGDARDRVRFETRLARRPARTVLVGSILLTLGVAGIPRLRVQDAWVDNFDPHSALVQAERAYNAHFWGSYRWDIVIEREPGYFFGAAGMALLERVESEAAAASGAGGVVSAIAPLAQMALQFGETAAPSSLGAPRLAELVALVQMAHERTGILQLLTPDGAAARLRVHLNSADYARTEALRNDLDARLAPLLGGMRWHASGELPVALDVVHAVVDSQLRSAATAIAGIALLLWVALRSLKDSLVALVPVAAAATLLFGAMGWGGIPLGIATSMFASLSIGVGIDFALHVLHHYREARRAGKAHAGAVDAAIERTGSAIRWNTMVLTLGLLVLCFSSLRPDRTLGLLLASAVFGCWVMTLLFLPALLRYVHIALVAVCMLIPATGAAEDEPPGDPAAEGAVRAVEMAFRRGARCVRMQVTTQFAPEQTLNRTLWSVLSSDATATRILYVFTKPDDLRGMSLLVADRIDPSEPDSTWLYLPGFKNLSLLHSPDQTIMVPGTALTNEDARGFVSADAYRFRFADSSAAPGSGGKLLVDARPRNPRIRLLVGYDRLRIRIDEKRRLVERVEFTGLDGKLLKTFELIEAARVRSTWLPRRARIRHVQFDFESDVDYSYWPLAKAPPAAVFRAGLAPELFLPRLERVLALAGQRVEPADPAPARAGEP